MKTAIGIDIGGTSIKACLADDNARILESITVPTKSSLGRDAVLSQMDKIVKRWIRDDTVGGGIGAPGIIDPNTGTVAELGFNIRDWKGTHLTKSLQEAYPDRIWLADNDANCAALGEAWVGAGFDLSSFVMLTLGTGVGGAFFRRPEGIWHGAHAHAGEYGHLIYEPEGRLCNCGQRGCIEQYISASALKKTYTERTGSAPRGTVFSLAKKDEQARLVVDAFCRDLANYLVTLKHCLDPEAFLIGGGLVYDADVWWNDVERLFAETVNVSAGTMLRRATKRNEAGMLGAAGMVFSKGEKDNGFANSAR